MLLSPISVRYLIISLWVLTKANHQLVRLLPYSDVPFPQINLAPVFPWFLAGRIKIQDILACGFLDDLLEVGAMYVCMYYFQSLLLGSLASLPCRGVGGVCRLLHLSGRVCLAGRMSPHQVGGGVWERRVCFLFVALSSTCLQCCSEEEGVSGGEGHVS